MLFVPLPLLEEIALSESYYLTCLPLEALDQAAQYIAGFIRGLLRSLEPGLRALELVAARFGVEIRWQSDATDRGGYVPPFQPGDFGEIVLSTGLGERQRWRAFFHELSHHLMFHWTAKDQYQAECVILLVNPGEVDYLRQRIARKVEALLV